MNALRLVVVLLVAVMALSVTLPPEPASIPIRRAFVSDDDQPAAAAPDDSTGRQSACIGVAGALPSAIEFRDAPPQERHCSGRLRPLTASATRAPPAA